MEFPVISINITFDNLNNTPDSIRTAIPIDTYYD